MIRANPRRIVFLVTSVMVVLIAGCAAPTEPPTATGGHQGAAVGTATTSPTQSTAPVPRRLLVLRLGRGAPEVLRWRTLPPASARATRPRPPGWDGRYDVVDDQGRSLASGAFRIPRRVHALRGAVGGPAGPASAPLPQPVIWLRADTPPGAAQVRLWDRGRGIALGEVTL